MTTKKSDTIVTTSATPEFLQGGGEMGQLMRDYEWSKTSLGSPAKWPNSLKTCIRIMLTSRQPIWIGWGKDLIKFYNDPYKDIVQGKHPAALGSPASVVWKDIWRDIEPMLKEVMENDRGTYVESQLLFMERNGYPEETYYTFSYTPIPGDNGGTEGMICFNVDDTDRITSGRQLKTLTQLAQTLPDSKTSHEVISRTIDVLKQNPWDFPFAVFRTLSGRKAVLQMTTDDEFAKKLEPELSIDADTEGGEVLRRMLDTRQVQVYQSLKSTLGDVPKGAWGVAPKQSLIIPVVKSGKELFGTLVVGMNPYRLFDDKYRSFFSLVADQISTSFTTINILEEERRRAEALAEIDRAKTTFFSNISHEFRTPLTLLLAPVEDAMNDPQISSENKIRMEVAYRNALRMQKLVNTLLEFSRIEAGRSEGKFTRVDICSFTEDLASTFRSAIERSGMHLRVHCEKIVGEVYVDPDMWERIILNLVSNAFKYSNAGEIRVDIRQADKKVRVSVSDTGVGIPGDQIDRIFDRFYRVENTGGRSQEGTGIGLSMVKELVKLHHGTIGVTSEPNIGSTFTVTIPVGKEHLNKDRIVTSDTDYSIFRHSTAFVQEALKWMPDETHQAENNPVTKTGEIKGKVLLADDNADMRDYVKRLLSEQFTVITAKDGEEAYQKILEFRPDLLLSDIMMPKLDGFGLLAKVRSHPEIKTIPVIFLSARAGEEAKVEGLDAGADDYLVKPFSAKELLVRVTNHIRINQVRRETEMQFYQLFLEAPALVNIFKGPDFRFELFHPKNKELFGDVDYTGRRLEEVLPELKAQGVIDLMEQVYHEGKTIYEWERRVAFHNSLGDMVDRYLNFIYQPWYDLKGNIQGVLNFAIDVTDQVVSRKSVEESEKRYRYLSERLEVMVDQRTSELRRSNEDLQQFAHVASHDLKEPVRKLKTFINRLEDEFKDEIPEKGMGYIQKMRHASSRMYAMIEGVLKYSSLSETQEEIGEVDLNEVIRNIEADLEVVINQKHAVIKMGNLPRVEGAQVLLYQLFYNLINNSLKFCVQKPEITITSSSIKNEEKDCVEISVKDNGIGFDPQFSDRLFDAFLRLNPKDKYEGTGLGLALCKKIVERHHGAIRASGEEGRGSEFIITLPVRHDDHKL
jgi:signal transduction histidine kinase/CheY-like chemotaxis protein